MDKHWFKRKRYGWGWVPVTWQGWLTIFVYILIVLAATLSIKDRPEDGFPAEMGVYLIVFWITTVAMIMISYKHGPTPKWRWGKKEGDNPKEDF